MSEIRDDELDIGLNENVSNNNRDTVYAEPVRGADALKGFYSKNNRKRLYFYLAAGGFLLLALVYTFTSTKNPEVAGSDGVIEAGQISGRAVGKRDLIDREEADRYNSEQLEREQQENIYAHPVITTDADDGLYTEEEYSPFAEQTNLKTPDRLSESGSTRANNQNGQQQQVEYYDEDAHRSADDLARILIDGEATVPVLQKVSWTYSAVKGSQNEDAAVDAVDQEPSGPSCAVSLARAGTMVMGTIDLALNSDVGGPASLTIRNGKLRGARLIGSFERKEEWLRLEFNKLVMPSETVSVAAIGLDLDTTLNAVTGKVDRHLMYRYGWWGFGTVLSAVGKASAANANTQSYVSDGVISQNTVKDSKREIKMALGSMGEDIGEIMRSRVDRPITVTLKSGDEVGVFFLDDACLEKAK